MKPNRLYFIDAVRAFAILMMLQGHFIDTLMDVAYKDDSNLAFSIWKYLRGITAPTFFTISGLIFSYLLLKAKQKGTSTQRMRKGFNRGLMLIGIGYVLRIPLLRWLSGAFSTYFLVVDVLQCIGLSLILIVLLYKISFKRTLIFSVLTLCLGTIIFLTEPLYRTLELPEVPKIIAHYLTRSYGSIFTIIPWFGYMCYGAFISTIFYRYLEHPRFKISTVTGFFVIGVILILAFAGYWMFQDDDFDNYQSDDEL